MQPFVLFIVTVGVERPSCTLQSAARITPPHGHAPATPTTHDSLQASSHKSISQQRQGQNQQPQSPVRCIGAQHSLGATAVTAVHWCCVVCCAFVLHRVVVCSMLCICASVCFSECIEQMPISRMELPNFQFRISAPQAAAPQDLPTSACGLIVR